MLPRNRFNTPISATSRHAIASPASTISIARSLDFLHFPRRCEGAVQRGTRRLLVARDRAGMIDVVGEVGKNSRALENRVERRAAQLDIAREQSRASFGKKRRNCDFDALSAGECEFCFPINGCAADPGQIEAAEFGKDRDHRRGHFARRDPFTELLVFGFHDAVGVRDDWRSVRIDPSAAQRIVDEVGGVAAEECEVRQRRTRAQEIRMRREMRAGHPEPWAQNFGDPRIDVRGRHAEGLAGRGNVGLNGRVGLVAWNFDLMRGVTRQLPSTDAMVFLVEPSRADGGAVEPFVERVFEDVVDEAQDRIGRDHAWFRKA